MSDFIAVVSVSKYFSNANSFLYSIDWLTYCYKFQAFLSIRCQKCSLLINKIAKVVLCKKYKYNSTIMYWFFIHTSSSLKYSFRNPLKNTVVENRSIFLPTVCLSDGGAASVFFRSFFSVSLINATVSSKKGPRSLARPLFSYLRQSKTITQSCIFWLPLAIRMNNELASGKIGRASFKFHTLRDLNRDYRPRPLKLSLYFPWALGQRGSRLVREKYGAFLGGSSD